MKKVTYIFAISTLFVSSFLTYCSADDISDDYKNKVIVNATAGFDQIVLSDRPK